MNITESFANFFQTISGTTLGQDLFIGHAPSSNKVQDPIWWITATGGNIETNLVTVGAIKRYVFTINYRDRSYRTVYDMVQQIEEALNCENCIDLEGYTVIEAKTSILGIDDDLDLEDRKVGALGVEVIVHKQC